MITASWSLTAARTEAASWKSPATFVSCGWTRSSLDGVRAKAVTAWPLARAALTQRAPVPCEAPRTRTLIRTLYVSRFAFANGDIARATPPSDAARSQSCAKIYPRRRLRMAWEEAANTGNSFGKKVTHITLLICGNVCLHSRYMTTARTIKRYANRKLYDTR